MLRINASLSESPTNAWGGKNPRLGDGDLALKKLST